ncbi:phenylacetate--CoA ligase family protein [Poseidonibacter lekithochrous]|uniref:phenylacetate--CoA ligase family protein n=1 Tax=Poseidonibacter lekithochrous TaxID=1904463 RepID=UPI000D35B73A|nr:phenylacetate--CoA ligase family protein [Poseidonibacter lekithochrous]
MINYILKNTVFLERLNLIKQKQIQYENIIDSSDIFKYQLDRFNIIWQKAYTEIPFYEKWKKKYNLPKKINSLNELKKFPVLTKKDIQQKQNLIFGNLNNYSTISTGGSTGEPTKFPTSKNESINSYSNHYLARGWWDIKPLDEVLLFWGHSHLFGEGIKGEINQCKRMMSDWLISTKRLNAYDMSLDTLEKYYQELKKSNPAMILGYTSAIYKIAKYIDENNFEIGNKENLKGVVVTSETVTDYDIKLIEKVFKVPCILEYGMAETGVIAYSRKGSKNIKLFWDTFIGIKDSDNILNITTINDRLFPLINYKTDDIIETKNCLSVLTISKIFGRKNDFIKIKVADKIIECHSEFFTHILKSISGVQNFKIKQKKDLSIRIEYVSSKKQDISSIFFIEIKKEFKDIVETTFIFNQVDDIPKTIAGKTKWIEIEK